MSADYCSTKAAYTQGVFCLQNQQRKSKKTIDIWDAIGYTVIRYRVVIISRSAEVDERSVLHMKKIYDAPVLELLAFCSASAIGSDFEEGDPNDSKPWNDGELGWT